MDNLTHSLIGVVLGSAALGQKNASKKAVVLTAIIGSNFPDIDIVLRPMLSHLSFGYLLHHRGYTHTFLAALPLGILAAVLGSKLAREPRRPSGALLLLGVLSVLLHIGADFCNNYGVHPLTPFSNRWFYGDSIFIVEPLLFLVLLPFAYFTAVSNRLKKVILGLEIGLLAVVLGQAGLAGGGSASLILAEVSWAAFWFFITWKFRNAFFPVMGIGLVVASFGWNSIKIKENLRQSMEALSAEVRVQKIATTPSPGNPFCWGVMVLSLEGQDYVARSGVVSLWPSLFNPSNCYLARKHSSLESAISMPSPVLRMVWNQEFRRPKAEFTDLREKNCVFRAFLKFARMPVWYAEEGKSYAEDFRYYGQVRRGFSRVDLSQECDERLPDWEPPTSGIQ